MNVKKAILIFLAAVVVITAAVAGYLYYRLNQPSDLPTCIPKEADRVYFANSGQIIQLYLSGKLKHGFSEKEYQRNEYLKNIPDLKKTGIAFLKGAAFVEYKGINYGIIQLEDAGKFAENIARIDRQLLNTAEDHTTFKKVFAKRDSFTLAWNEDLLVFFPKMKKNALVTDAYIGEILDVKKTACFVSNSFYMQVKKDDALAWFFNSRRDLRISTPSALKGYLMYDSSFSIYATSNIEQPYKDIKFYEPASAAHNFIYADTANRFTNKMMLQLAEIFMPDEMHKIKQLEFNTFRKVFLLQGQQVLENRIVSYVYDDDFNKHEIETLQKDTVHKAFMSLIPPGHLWGAHFSSLPLPAFDTTFNIYRIPDKVKIMAHFNQDFTRTIFPLDFNYDIQFIYQQEGRFNEYRLRLRVDNLRAMFKAQLVD